jgi:catalase-peroxidase
MTTENKCPVLGDKNNRITVGGGSNQHWWPNQLNLKILHQNPTSGNPMGEGFVYAKRFLTLDLDSIRKDL